MAASQARTDAVLSRLTVGEAQTHPTSIRRPLRQNVVRPVTAAFVAVPLVAAVMGLGNPSLLLTLSGLAALYLAADLLMERMGHPISPDRLLRVNLVTWIAGFAILGAAGWTPSSGEFHGELIVLVAAMVAGFVGIVTQPVPAVLCGVAAMAAAALGASLKGPVTAETVIAASAIAVGTLVGTTLAAILLRVLDRRRLGGTAAH